MNNGRSIGYTCYCASPKQLLGHRKSGEIPLQSKGRGKGREKELVLSLSCFYEKAYFLHYPKNQLKRVYSQLVLDTRVIAEDIKAGIILVEHPFQIEGIENGQAVI